jgi:hypothetical protein
MAYLTIGILHPEIVLLCTNHITPRNKAVYEYYYNFIMEEVSCPAAHNMLHHGCFSANLLLLYNWLSNIS